MKAVAVIEDLELAKVLVDPMRRAILDLLRRQPMTQAQLADVLGLSDPSLNYHMKILRSYKLVTISGRSAEMHGIMQKFFSPSAYLFVYDLDSLPRNIARYFYPISLERARAVLSSSTLKIRGPGMNNDSTFIDSFSMNLARNIVKIARNYTEVESEHGNESLAYEIYQKAIKNYLAELAK